MTDRKKVINGLCHHKEGDCDIDCPYYIDDDCSECLCGDALALLREQEPVRPETVVRTGIREEPTIQALVCGNCHKIMGYCVVYNFCPWCGRAVKWNEAD